eukprot:9611-Amphidinium_carterae.1
MLPPAQTLPPADPKKEGILLVFHTVPHTWVGGLGYSSLGFGGFGIRFASEAHMHCLAGGNGLISPVGNRVNVVDLVQGRTVTFAPENSEAQ